MKTFVIGDCHGRFEALKEVLKKSNFDYLNDRLILLGDIVDGGPRTVEVVDELLKIKNVVFVLGNHDKWFINHLNYGCVEENWEFCGGRATLKAYENIKRKYPNYPKSHVKFFMSAVNYFIEDNMIFVHGGFDPRITIEENSRHTLLWDRELLDYARTHKIERKDINTIDKPKTYWDKIFIGHSTTLCVGKMEPVYRNNLIMMDTGAGNLGKLTIMDVNTEEFWQSKRQGDVMKR